MKKKHPVIGDDDSDPEIRSLMRQVEEDRAKGILRSPPRKKSDCHTLEDLCLYVFKLADLEGSYQMLKTDSGIDRWVWFGHDFGDRLVDIVEEVAQRIPNKEQLRELRLVSTKVTPNGIQRLRCVFPKARVRVYTDEDDKRDWQLSQASYCP